MKNINNQAAKSEKVEVMALFNYSRIPCQPLYYRKAGEGEVEIALEGEIERAAINRPGGAEVERHDLEEIAVSR